MFGVLFVPALLVALLSSSSDEDSLRRIQDLTARLQKLGRRAHLAVTWRRPAGDG